MQIAQQRGFVELLQLPARPTHRQIRAGLELTRPLVVDLLPQLGQLRDPPISFGYTGATWELHALGFEFTLEFLVEDVALFPEEIPQLDDVVLCVVLIDAIVYIDGIRAHQPVHSIAACHQ
ncbi:hypothetical protein [Xanthomonas oryzae]|uniref:hypothetical protein n=1 Tax=Xanthomonas oryzae TaxID=347 RepID=UPI003D02FC13